MVVNILTVKNFFQKETDRVPEFCFHPMIVVLAEQVLELDEDVLVLSRVELGVLLALQLLDLEKEMDEHLRARNDIDVDR